MDVKQEKMPTGIENFLRGAKAGTETPTETVETKEEVVEAKTETETETPVDVKTETPADTKEDTVEAKAETEAKAEAETKTETETETETPKDEGQKEWWKDEKTETTESKEGAEPSLEKKAEILDGLLSNPEVKYFLENIRAGKTLSDIANEFQVVDYDKMDDETIIKTIGTQLELSDEEMEESLESFNSLNPLQRKEQLKRYRNELKSNQSSAMEQRTNELRKGAPDNDKIAQKFQSEIKQKQDYMVGKDYYGVKMTEKDSGDFKEYCDNFFDTLYNPDGSPNVNFMLEGWLGTQKLPKIQSVNFKNGRDEGAREVLKEVHRPSESNAAVSSQPKTKEPVSANDASRQALKRIFGQPGQK